MINAATQYPLDDSIDPNTGKLIAKRPSYKREVCGLSFLRLKRYGMNQPEASRLYGETCLHTMVSTFQNEYGIQIFRRLEPWTHRHNGKTHFNRYWIADYQAELKMVSLVNRLREKRGMAPINFGEYFKLPNRAA